MATDIVKAMLNVTAKIEQNEIIRITDSVSRPTDLEMVEVLAAHYGANENDVALWLSEIDHAALIGDLS